MKCFLTLLALLFAFAPLRMFAYEIPTHAYLTDETVNLYNRQFSSAAISGEAKDDLVEGSRNEDADPRYLNHFYDPVNGTGLSNPLLGRWKSSRDWAKDENSQSALLYKISPSAETDFTWQRAIRYYLRGDRQKAMLILGHILHLIEDMAVPDHTRNDVHFSGSPYEAWASRFRPGQPDPVLRQNLKAGAAFRLKDLDAYFDGLAAYSNNNFYSKDTIGIQAGYSLPQPDTFERSGSIFYALGRDGEGSYRLYAKSSGQSFLLENTFGVSLQDDGVLKDYWERLSPKAVQYGAGVLDLFFQEAERLRNDPSFAKDEPKTLLAEIAASAKSVAGGAIKSVKSFFSGIRNESTPPPVAATSQRLPPPKPLPPPIPVPAPASPVKPAPQPAEAVPVAASAAPEVSPVAPVTAQKPVSAAASKIAAKAPDTPRITPSPNITIYQSAVEVAGLRRLRRAKRTVTAASAEPGGASSSPNTASTTAPTSTESGLDPTPLVSDFHAEFSRNDLTVHFDWVASDDPDPALYSIRETDGLPGTLIYNGTSTAASTRVYEVGKEQTYVLTAKNGQREESFSATLAVPGLLDNLYFYRDPREATRDRYLADMRYSGYPFIPGVLSGSEHAWQGMVFYLNREPNPENYALQGLDLQEPFDLDGVLKVGDTNIAGRDPHAAVFGLQPNRCVSFGQPGIAMNCFYLSPEDPRLVLDVGPDASRAILGPDDYITVGYYDFDMMSHDYLKLIATDARRFHFQNLPASEAAPSAPSGLTIGFEPFSARFDLRWATSTDPDSPDQNIRYEFNVTSSTDFAADAWRSTGPGLENRTFTLATIPAPGNYMLGVRALDEFDQASDPVTAPWPTPAGWTPYILSGPVSNVSQSFIPQAGGRLDSVQVFNIPVELYGANPDGYTCTLTIFDPSFSPAPVAVSDTPHHAGYTCTGQPVFTFRNSSINLAAGHLYRWAFNFNYPTGATVRFYGRGDNAAGGMFSDPSLVNAAFVVSGTSGVLMDNR